MLKKTLQLAKPQNKLRPVYAYFHSKPFLLEQVKVSAELVKRLRKSTDAPLGQCKMALEESVGYKNF